MKFALSIFIRLNIFAFCILLNLHEAKGLPPLMSRFLNRFVYRRSKGKRHGAHRYKPAVFDDRYPADTEIVFRVANNYNVPSVDYSQIDFGQTYQIPPVENTYVSRPTAPISLHHYNSVPTRHTYSNLPSITSTSSYTNTEAVSQSPFSPVHQQTPSQIINSLREPTNLRPPSSSFSSFGESSNLRPPSSSFSSFGESSNLRPPSSSFSSFGESSNLGTPSSSINSLRPSTNLGPPSFSSFRESTNLGPLSASISPLGANTNLRPPSSINSSLNLNPFSLPFSSIKEFTPIIEIGKAPPPNYKVADNFQQSFQVTLTTPGQSKKKRSYQDNAYSSTSNNNNYGFTDLNTSGYTAPNAGYSQSNYGVPNLNGFLNNANNVSPPRTKQGSIVTRNKIYFSPRLLAYRSQPLQIARRTPPEKPFINVFSGSNKTVEFISNVSLVNDRVQEDRPQSSVNKADDKTYVAVRLQSYSTVNPQGAAGNDSDLVEAQKDYGFGKHNFLFSNTDSLLSVFEMLLRTDFENKGQQSAGAGSYGIPSGNSLEETMDCIKNFVNATERIHFWSHSRGEADAKNLFQVFPRDPTVDAIPFIDTAAVTDTLSATVF